MENIKHNIIDIKILNVVIIDIKYILFKRIALFAQYMMN